MAAVVKPGRAAAGLIAAGWALFEAQHFYMSHPGNREQLIGSLGGEENFRKVYSGLAVATFIPTTFIYWRYGSRAGNIPFWTSLTANNTGVRWAGTGCKVLASVLCGQAISTPNPIAETAMGNTKAENIEAKGVYRITRHGMFSSLALLGIGNLLTRGHLGDVVYWAGYPAVWAIGCMHQDYRMRNTLPESFYEQTSLVPFGAIVEGKNSLTDAVKEFHKPTLIMSVLAPLFLL